MKKFFLLFVVAVLAVRTGGRGMVDAAELTVGPNPEQQVAPQEHVTAEQGATPQQPVVPDQQAAAEKLGLPAVITNSIGMKLVLIPAGKFLMGALAADAGQIDQKQHRVRITRPFHLGVCEVTQGQYERVMGTNPSRFKDGPQHPVCAVSWKDAVAFCDRFSALAEEKAAGRTYRLPTEAEWEYACRAGTTTRFSFGDDFAGSANYAWFAGNSGLPTPPVGLKRPNAWGLYDMHGSVWELCADWYGDNYYRESPMDDPTGPVTGSERVRRGGSCFNWAVTSADRDKIQPDSRNDLQGFRVIAVPSASPANGAAPTAGTRPEQQAASQDHAVAEQPATPPQQATSEQQAAAEKLGLPVVATNSIGMQLVLVPAGEFMMGSPAPEDGRRTDDEQHRVRITKPFYLGAQEVTQAQYQQVIGTNPSHFQDADARHPVETVGWDDAVWFCEKLSALAEEQAAGRTYRLPTEAEWEYACRAGSSTRFSFGESDSSLGDYAWFNGNSGSSTRPVGQTRPNAWGLFDMHGNVREWCADWGSRIYYRESPVDDPTGPAIGNHRVARGGSWDGPAAFCQSASRVASTRLCSSDLGFRVVAVPSASPANRAAATAGSNPEQQTAAEKLGLPVATTNSIGMQLVLIPAGEFLMGSPETEQGRENELQHRVRITKPFHLGVHEVTQAQYQQVMGTNSSYLKDDRHPVDTVSWDDAVEFCAKLSALPSEKSSDRVYRLPTEAEWEYACRAGSTTRFSFGDSHLSLGQYAWFRENPGTSTRPVSLKRPNAWGLYDMHGNVWEWCADWYDENYYGYRETPMDDPPGPITGQARVARGGSWFQDAAGCRAARRSGHEPDSRNSVLGFRVVAVPSASPANGAAPTAGSSAAQQAASEQQAAAEKLGLPSKIPNSIGMQLVLIPAGEFMMGSPATEAERFGSEQPHRVRITKPFYLGVHEVTQAQYQQVMETNPSAWRDTQNPVHNVSWDDAVTFCDKLSALPGEKLSGRIYRLPTEAEWEFACRAGSTTRFSFGDDPSRLADYAWFGESASWPPIHPVGQKRANAWSLCDMQGNVSEWCADWYDNDYYLKSPVDNPTGPATGSSRVYRGASWGVPASFCRSAFRYGGNQPNIRNDGLGFRVATVPSSK